MGKKRKKVIKQRRRSPPAPLSKRDRWFYYVIIFLILAALFAGLFLRLLAREKLAFRDASVLAANETGSVALGEIAHMLLMLTLFLYFVIGLGLCRPVFDRKQGYVGNPVYHTIPRPLFVPNPKPSKLARRGKILLVSWVAVCLLLSGLSYYGRVTIDNSGTIHTYNAFNTEETEEAPNVTELHLSVRFYTRKSEFRRRYYPVLTLYTRSGERYRFPLYNFAGDIVAQRLEAMLSLKAIFPKQYFIIDEGALAHIYDIRDTLELDREAYLLLCELFDAGESYT